jgi:hypothetical protein
MSDDLSDEAFEGIKQVCREKWGCVTGIRVFWECRRLAVAQIEEARREAFRAAWKTCAVLWDGDASETCMEQSYRAWREQPECK